MSGPLERAVDSSLTKNAFGSVNSAAYADAMRAARANETARNLGFPPDVVEDDYANMQNEERLRKRIKDTQFNQAYARIMSNHRFAAAAMDDDHLPEVAKKVDNHAASFGSELYNLVPKVQSGNYLSRGLVSGLFSTASVLGQAAEAFNPVSSIRNLIGNVKDIGHQVAYSVRTGDLYGDKAAYLRNQAAQAKSTPFTRFAEQMQRASQTADTDTPGYSELVYGTTDPSKAAWLSPTRMVHDAIQSLPTTVALAATVILTKGAAARGEAQALAAGIEPTIAKQVGIKAAVKMASIAGAATEGAAGGLQQSVSVRTQVLDETAIEDSPYYKQLVKAGVNAADARQFIATRAGGVAGMDAAAVDAATNLVGGKFLGKIIGEGGGLMVRTAKGFANEAGVEAVQSGGEQLAANAAIGEYADPHQDLVEGVVESVLQGFFVGGLTGGAFAGVLGRSARTDRDAHAARAVDSIMESAAQSPTRTANPSGFTEALNQLVGDTAAEHLYIPVEQVDALFAAAEGEQAKPLADDPFWGQYANHIEEARALGSDVVVPLAEVATHLAGTPQWQALRDHVRTSPQGSSISEAKAKQTPEELEKMAGAVAKGLEQNIRTVQVRVARAAVSDWAEGMGYKGEQADAVNMVLTHWLLQNHAADTQRRLAAGQQPITMGEFATNTLPDRVEMKQADFDKGGATGAMSQTFTREQLERMDIDELDRMAFGVIGGDVIEVDPSQLKIKYPGDLENPEARFAKEGMDWANSVDLSEPIDVSVNDKGEYDLEDGHHRRFAALKTGRKLKAKIEIKGKPIEAILRKQSSFDQTNSEAFRNWFGDSKVVDENGEPLVVYHGTGQDIKAFDPAHPYKKDYGWFGEGNYFSESPNIASAYATLKERGMAGANVMPVFLSIQNPYYATVQEKGEIQRGGRATADAFKAAVIAAGHDGVIWKEGGEYVTFDPEQIKSAIGNKGTFDPNDPNILNQAEPFYSAAERAVETAKQERASAGQWKALLTPGKTPGIKAEEIEWTGIHEWLDMQTGPVEKAVLLQVLRDKGIRVEEVVLGDANWDEIRAETDRRHDAEYQEALDRFYENGMGDGLYVEGAQVEEQEDDDGEPYWVVEGETFTDETEAYDRAQELSDEYRDSVEREAAEDYARDRQRSYDDVEDEVTSEMVLDPQFQSWSSDPNNKSYRELLITLPIGTAGNPTRAPSTHWDTESVVAHTRFMEKWEPWGPGEWEEISRTELSNTPEASTWTVIKRDPRGRRVLLVEEVQSDWHQKGRDQGYEQPLDSVKIAAAQEAVNDASAAWTDAREKLVAVALEFADSPAMKKLTSVNFDDKGGFSAYLDTVSTFTMRAAISRDLMRTAVAYDKVTDQQREAVEAEEEARLRHSEANQALSNATSREGIPNAPFKSSWPALVMKRLIRYAAEEGYDRVAWTTGEEQADRYNLSQAVGTLTYRVGEDGRVQVHTEADRGYEALRQYGEMGPAGSTFFTEEQAKETFGQEIARKMWAGEGGEADDVGFRKLGGSDLRVGGEGMKAFYDRNLVNITNDIVKKYGAKVGWVSVSDASDALLASRFETARRLRAMGEETAATEEEAAAERMRQGTPRPGFDVTDKMREAVMQGQPLFQQKRGNISIERDSRGMMTGALIRAFESANFSTAIHELGHFFLENLRNQALDPNATDQQKADWQTYKDWVFETIGLLVTDDQMVPRDAHELFARGTEHYVYKGLSPSKALRELFGRMSEFMKRIYKSAKDFNAPITPAIREVMDRMLASDAEIAEQREEMQLAATAMNDLMSDAERAEYQALSDDAKDSARERLYERILSALRAEKTAEARSMRAEIEAEVVDQVDAMPIMQAMKLLRVGMKQDDGSFARVRLSREWLVDSYGDDIESKLPTKGIPIVSDKDTMDADQIAAMTGFDSGDALVRALMQYEEARMEQKASGDRRSPRQTAIDTMVEDRVREEIGDPFTNLAEEAQAALASDKQADAISMELRAIARRSGRKPTAWKMATEWAKARIAITTEKELNQFRLLASRTAAKAAHAAEEALVKQDWNAAFEAKQRQLLNLAIVQEASRARDEVDKAERRMKKVARRPTIKSTDQEYLEQAQQLLEDVGLRNRTSIKRKTFEAWHLEQVQLGVEPIVGPEYRYELAARNWRTLSVEDVLTLDKVISQIRELGRLSQSLRDGQNRIDFDEGVAQMQAIAEAQKQRPQTADNDPNRTMGGRIKSRLRGVDAAMIKIEQLVDWLDGGDSNGPWNRLIFQRMAEAQGRENDLMRTYVEEINSHIKGLGKKQLKGLDRKVSTPNLLINVPGHPQQGQPWQFTKDQIIMMAMNWGNAGNRQRLADGFGWQPEQVEDALAQHMTKEDWDFVQNVWDTVDKLWPELEALERRTNGVPPEKVEEVEVQTPFGVYRGGYFPAVYDTQYSKQAEQNEASKLSPNGAAHQITVRSSASKGRAVAVKNRPLLLSMSVITRHLGEVIHDITHREAVAQVRKLLNDDRVRVAVGGAMGPEYYKKMGTWLENIATPNAASSKSDQTLISMARHLNKGVSLVGLGFRLSTILVQPIGMSNMIGVVGKDAVANGLRIFTAHPVATYREVMERSAEMRSRFSTMDASIEDMVADANSGKLATLGPKGLMRHAFDGILYVDMAMTTSGWIGAFNKGLKEGMSEDEAAYYADKMIRDSQGAGGNKDRSAILYENQFARTFWPFFSYLNALYNQQRDVFHRGIRGADKVIYKGGNTREGVNEMAGALNKAWWVMIVPALLEALIFGDGPDEDDEESWAGWLAKSVLLGNLGSIPGVNAVSAAIGSGYGYRSNAWQGIGEGIKKAWDDADKAMETGVIKGSSIQNVMNTVGILFAKPLGQAASTTRGVHDYMTGDAQPEDAGDWYELLTKGRVSKKPTAAERLLGEE